ncbi:MAG: hypothetical protein WCC87_06160 [Candidatus Korobacteraceae bacterium]
MSRTALAVIVLFAVWPCSAHSQSAESQAQQPGEFQQVWCFAGQIRVNGKRLTRQPFEVFAAKDNLACCGELIKSSRTDEHGHFLVEPLLAGKYYAKFENRSSEEIVSFAVRQNYQKCDWSHLEIKFLPDGKSTMQEYADVDYDKKNCNQDDPACCRK